MKRIAFLAAAVGLSMVAAWPASADQIKISVGQGRDILVGLQNLDGYKDANDKPVYYHFGGATRLIIAHDEAVLRQVSADYESARQILLAEASDQSSKMAPEKRTAAMRQVDVESQKMLGEKQDMDLILISATALDLDKNPIPPSVLTLIVPILDMRPAAAVPPPAAAPAKTAEPAK